MYVEALQKVLTIHWGMVLKGTISLIMYYRCYMYISLINRCQKCGRMSKLQFGGTKSQMKTVHVPTICHEMMIKAPPLTKVCYLQKIRTGINMFKKVSYCSGNMNYSIQVYTINFYDEFLIFQYILKIWFRIAICGSYTISLSRTQH